MADPVFSRASALAVEADRAQAVYFRDELSRQLAALDQQIAVYRRALQRFRTRSQATQIRATEHALQGSQRERQSIQQMLDKLTARFLQL